LPVARGARGILDKAGWAVEFWRLKLGLFVLSRRPGIARAAALAAVRAERSLVTKIKALPVVLLCDALLVGVAERVGIQAFAD